jgi:hypothetical protein
MSKSLDLLLGKQTGHMDPLAYGERVTVIALQGLGFSTGL